MESDAVTPIPNATGHSRSLLISILYPTLLILGALGLFVGNLLIWIDSTVFNSASFTSVISNTLDQEKVQARIADVLATEIVDTGVIQEELKNQVPSQLSFVTPLVNTQLHDIISRVASTVLASDFIGSLRNEAVERLHGRVLAILEGDKTVLQIEGDQLVISFKAVFDRVFDEIGITPPAQLEQAVGTGDIVIVDNVKNLERASYIVRNRTEITLIALAIAAVGLIGGIAAAPGRRHGAIVASWVVIGVGLVTLVAVIVGNLALATGAAERTVARELVKSLEVNLKWQTLGLVILGACGLCAADTRILAWLQSLEGALGRRLEAVGTARALLVLGGGAAVALFIAS